MPSVWRDGRAVNGRPAVQVDPELAKSCPVCGAAPGWRCVKKTRWSLTALKRSHKERF